MGNERVPSPTEAPQRSDAQLPNHSPTDDSPVLSLLITLAQEIHKLNSNMGPVGWAGRQAPSHPLPGTEVVPTRKRKRVQEEEDSIDRPRTGHELYETPETVAYIFSCLLVDEVLDELVDVYFASVHAWIPMIHEANFREHLRTDYGRQRMSVVLHAMTVAALRFVQKDGKSLPAAYVAAETARSRRLVTLTAVDGLSLENLQALAIVAYADVRIHGSYGTIFCR